MNIFRLSSVLSIYAFSCINVCESAQKWQKDLPADLQTPSVLIGEKFLRKSIFVDEG